MTYHLVLSKAFDFAATRRDVAAGLRPDHVMVDLADRMGMTVHAPADERAILADKARAKLCGTPAFWAMARRVAGTLADGDVVLCNGEDVGLPLAVVAGKRVKVAAFVHNLDRPRMRVALKAMRWGSNVALWLTPCEHQADFLRGVGIPAERVKVVLDRTDTRFFTPPTAAVAKPRPVIASVGLEGRDYRTLAAATEGLAVDVRISGFSADARAMRDAFPDPMPANMTRRYYEWTELADLYRSADVVVVSLFERTYAAGVTTFLEGMASGKPIVISETLGMRGYIAAARAAGVPVETVPVGDAAAMRAKIVALLGDAPRAADAGRRARAYVEARHPSAVWLAAVEDALQELAGGGARVSLERKGASREGVPATVSGASL